MKWDTQGMINVLEINGLIDRCSNILLIQQNWSKKTALRQCGKNSVSLLCIDLKIEIF